MAAPYNRVSYHRMVMFTSTSSREAVKDVLLQQVYQVNYCCQSLTSVTDFVHYFPEGEQCEYSTTTACDSAKRNR
ncbi:hypothetical protein ACTXT7_016776 [Hymenolepis weldensis]